MSMNSAAFGPVFIELLLYGEYSLLGLSKVVEHGLGWM